MGVGRTEDDGVDNEERCPVWQHHEEPLRLDTLSSLSVRDPLHKLRNLAKIVSAARVVPAALLFVSAAGPCVVLGPEPVLQTWFVIDRSTSVWDPDPDPTATHFRGVTWPNRRSAPASVRCWFRELSWFSRGTLIGE